MKNPNKKNNPMWGCPPCTCSNLLILSTLFLLLFGAKTASAISITVNVPSATTACANNIYTIIFPSGISTSSSVIITPSLVYNGGALSTCVNVASAKLEYVGHSGSGTISNIASGNTLSFFISTNTTPDTVRYRAYLDCNVIQNNQGGTINLLQTFTGSPFTINGNGNTVSVGVSYPNIQEANANANMTANYLSSGKFTFYYTNNGLSPARMRFTFNPDSVGNHFCGALIFDSINYKRNSLGSSITYLASTADTITLGVQDTLIVEQYVHSTTCISSCTDTLRAIFNWRCNYGTIASSDFCDNCNNGLRHVYKVFPNNNIAVGVERISPMDSTYDFSCMNDTANATLWSYRIINKGTTAIDSVKFNISQLADNILSGKKFLMLMSKKSLSITKGVNSFCTVTDTIRIKTDRLCYNLMDTAVFNCYVTVKDFLATDTVFVSFKLLRCSEEDNASLFNAEKSYNQFSFFPFDIKSKCGNTVEVKNTSGFYGSGTFISGQSAGSGYDVDLKTDFFPSVSDLTYANNTGDQATFNVQMKSLLNSKKPYVYQLLGCNEPNALCDTLQGWLRATVKVKANLIITNPATEVYLIKVNPSTSDTSYHAATWWNSITDITSCMDRDYYYYFNLNDAGMRNFLDSGQFVFKLTACCAVDSSPTPYRAEFHLLAKPSNSCFTTSLPAMHNLPLIISDAKQKWLSLSDEGNDIAVHCPGCVTPGLIVDFYKMERKTLGLQDSDQDGRSDSANANININSIWYAQNKNKLKQNFSGFGDRIEDVLRAHLEPGSTPNGYTYPQLQAQGLRFNALQLSRIIPMGLDTMKVIPDSLIFYIDAPLAGTCVDCGAFGLDSTAYNTQLKLVVTGSNIFTYFLDTLKNSDEYLFRFVDTANGNLHNTIFIDPSVTNTFNGFFEGQYYRMRTTYTVCGNFSPQGEVTIDDVVKENKIFNKMWVSGKVQNTSQIPQNPLDTIELHSLGYTVYATDTALGYNFVDTALINNHLFFCETRGGIHYFVGNVVGNQTTITNSPGCEKRMTVAAFSRAANGRAFYDVYPYEYRPVLFAPDSLILQVPLGYYISNSAVRNSVYFQSGDVLTDTVNFHLADSVDEVTIDYNSLPGLQKLIQTNNPVGGQTFYAGDQSNTRILEFRLLPLACIDSLVNHQKDTIAIVKFNDHPFTGIPNAGCNFDSTLERKVANLNSLASLGINPNLHLSSISNTIVAANSDTVCWRGIKLENINAGGDTITNADNVFIAIPILPNYISNWHFITQTNDTISINTDVLNITPTLAKGYNITGDLCARVISCPAPTDTVSFNINYGWNCGSFPTTPYNDSLICQYDSLQLRFTRAPVSFNTFNKDYNSSYTLCDTIYIRGQFVSYFDGYVYPYQVQLHNLNPALQIVNAYIYYTTPTSSDTTFLIPTASDTVWGISPDSIIALGYTEGGIHNSGNFWVRYDLIPTCSFLGNNTLPDIDVFARTFCGDTVNVPSLFTNTPAFNWSGISKCNDCFSLTKTANTDTVAIGDTVTFNIHVCSHNQLPDTLNVADLLPSSSVFTAITNPLPYSNNNFPADSCINFSITGTYKTVGNCPNSALQNKAVAASGAAIYKDSACVNVRYPCTNTLTKIIADSTFSSDSLIVARYDTTQFYVVGRFYINDNLTLASCTVKTAPGAQIIVQNNGYLNIANTTIQACTNMWRGIMVNDFGLLKVIEQASLLDADTAIVASNRSTIILSHATLLNNVIGIYTVPNGSNAYNNCNLSVTASTFGFAAFKPLYAGQQGHGAIPKAGIMLNGWSGNIGTYIDSTLTNHFSNLNCGILAWKGNVTVNNCKFNNMQPEPFYTWTPPFNYHGSAVCNIGDMANSINSSLIVKPVPANGITINNCHQGIKAYYSKLTVNNLRMDSVTVGIHSQFSKDYLATTITNNQIKAKRTGINLQFNAGAQKMLVSGNQIYSQQSNVPFRGIFINEGNGSGTANYLVKNNYLYLYRNSTGITMQGLYQDSVFNNYMEQNLPQNVYAVGINVNRSNNSYIQCNQVRNFNISNTKSRGYNFSLSNNNIVSCNTADSTGKGFYFGGQNNSTQLIANTMRNNEVGLYIQNAGVIGVQSNNGNLFIDYRDTIGAYNANVLTPTVTASEFDLKAQTQYNSWYFPKLSANNLQDNWFVVDPIITNNPLGCGSTCIVPPIEPNNELYYRIIAGDSVFTDEFIPESQSMARQYLYEVLTNNSDLLYSDVLFQEFYDRMKEEAEGQLNEVNRNLEVYGKMDSTFIPLFNTTDSLIYIYTYLSEHIDSVCDANQNLFCDSLREAFSVHINNLSITRQNIAIQYNTVITGVLQEVDLVNNLIQPEEVPEINSARLNEIFSLLEESQYSNIEEYYSELLAIAHQCPYYGGEAAYRARAILELVNDTLVYDDDVTCLVYGYYRKGSMAKQANDKLKITVRPNPANEYISVMVACKENETFSLQIINSLNQVVYKDMMQCNMENLITMKQLNQGIYTIIIKTKENSSSYKLAIIR